MANQPPEDSNNQNSGYRMSPLASVLLGILGKGAIGGGALLVLFTGLLLYQRWTPEGPVLSRQDYGVIGVMLFLFLMALYIVRSIANEMKNPGS